MTAYRTSEVAHNFPSEPLRGDTIDQLIETVDRVLGPAPPPTIHSSPLKFDAAFLDRRMAEHREWQEQAACSIGSEIVSEVMAAFQYVDQVRTGRGPGKIARLR